MIEQVKADEKAEEKVAATMVLLSKDQIISKSDITTADVPVPEWGGKVRVKMLTGRERDAFEESTIQQLPSGKTRQTLENVRAKLIARTVVDESGKLMFSPDDEAWLGDKGSAPLDRIYAASAKLSRITKEDVEELIKNSERTRPARG